jgi:hypothetical protein
MNLPLEIRFETYTRRSCQKCEDDSKDDPQCMESKRLCFAKKVFWFHDLVASEAFAKMELHRELFTRIVLFDGTEALENLS